MNVIVEQFDTLEDQSPGFLLVGTITRWNNAPGTEEADVRKVLEKIAAA